MLQITLSPLETLQGLLTVIFVGISLILGITIMLKYFKFKRFELILVGLTWIFIISPYWPDAISFLMIITTGQAIDTNLYILIGNLFGTWFLDWKILFGNPSITTGLGWFLFILMLIPGIWEEVAFRGVILNLQLKKYSNTISIMLYGVLFGLFHLTNLIT